MVSFCSFKISFPNTCTVLIFFIAGLLFLCLEHVEHWERIASRWETGLLIPSGTRSYRPFEVKLHFSDKVTSAESWLQSSLICRRRLFVGESLYYKAAEDVCPGVRNDTGTKTPPPKSEAAKHHPRYANHNHLPESERRMSQAEEAALNKYSSGEAAGPSSKLAHQVSAKYKLLTEPRRNRKQNPRDSFDRALRKHGLDKRAVTRPEHKLDELQHGIPNDPKEDRNEDISEDLSAVLPSPADPIL